MDTCRLKYIIGLDWFVLNNRSPYSGYFEIKPTYQELTTVNGYF